MKRAMILSLALLLLGCDAALWHGPRSEEPRVTTGRYLVTTASLPRGETAILVDTATGETWVACYTPLPEEAAEILRRKGGQVYLEGEGEPWAIQWCPMVRGPNP